jgi:hypothetical protein
MVARRQSLGFGAGKTRPAATGGTPGADQQSSRPPALGPCIERALDIYQERAAAGDRTLSPQASPCCSWPRSSSPARSPSRCAVCATASSPLCGGKAGAGHSRPRISRTRSARSVAASPSCRTVYQSDGGATLDSAPISPRSRATSNRQGTFHRAGAQAHRWPGPAARCGARGVLHRHGGPADAEADRQLRGQEPLRPGGDPLRWRTGRTVCARGQAGVGRRLSGV